MSKTSRPRISVGSRVLSTVVLACLLVAGAQAFTPMVEDTPYFDWISDIVKAYNRFRCDVNALSSYADSQQMTRTITAGP